MRPESSLREMFMSAGPRDVVWVTEFTPESAAEFYDQFVRLEKAEEVQVIPVFIHSYGGELYALTAMRDLIKSSPKPVATIAVGMAMSCGASLLACGTKGLRFASEDTQVLIHQVSGGAIGKTADIEEAAAQIKSMNDKLIDNLAKDTGKSREFFQRQIAKRHNTDWTISSIEAKKLGIIDNIAIPRILVAPPQSALGSPGSFDEVQAEMKERKKQLKLPKKQEKRQRKGKKPKA